MTNKTLNLLVILLWVAVFLAALILGITLDLDYLLAFTAMTIVVCIIVTWKQRTVVVNVTATVFYVISSTVLIKASEAIDVRVIVVLLFLSVLYVFGGSRGDKGA
ncbi:hypothetical protein HB777_04510 [Mesorhizobium loti]|nr:hypothetical protein HB777_04510 [Mesorhizobium loti]